MRNDTNYFYLITPLVDGTYVGNIWAISVMPQKQVEEVNNSIKLIYSRTDLEKIINLFDSLLAKVFLMMQWDLM